MTTPSEECVRRAREIFQRCVSVNFCQCGCPSHKEMSVPSSVIESVATALQEAYERGQAESDRIEGEKPSDGDGDHKLNLATTAYHSIRAFASYGRGASLGCNGINESNLQRAHVALEKLMALLSKGGGV